MIRGVSMFTICNHRELYQLEEVLERNADWRRDERAARELLDVLWRPASWVLSPAREKFQCRRAPARPAPPPLALSRAHSDCNASVVAIVALARARRPPGVVEAVEPLRSTDCPDMVLNHAAAVVDNMMTLDMSFATYTL